MEIPVRPLTLHSRREFCAQACRSASVLAAGALAACDESLTSPSSPSSGSQLPIVSGSANGRTVTLNVENTPALANVNSAALVSSSVGNFLVVRTAQASFTALTAVCTHEGCTVSGFNGTQFVCPCHGSRYTTTGAVANGPAPRALQQFPTTFANGVLTFTA